MEKEKEQQKEKKNGNGKEINVNVASSFAGAGATIQGHVFALPRQRALVHLKQSHNQKPLWAIYGL